MGGGGWIWFSGARLQDTPAAYRIFSRIVDIDKPEKYRKRGVILRKWERGWLVCWPTFFWNRHCPISIRIFSIIPSFNLVPQSRVHWGKQPGQPQFPPWSLLHPPLSCFHTDGCMEMSQTQTKQETVWNVKHYVLFAKRINKCHLDAARLDFVKQLLAKFFYNGWKRNKFDCVRR